MSAAAIPTSATTANSPRQNRYDLPALMASRRRPVAAQVASGTIDSMPTKAAMNRRV